MNYITFIVIVLCSFLINAPQPVQAANKQSEIGVTDIQQAAKAEANVENFNANPADGNKLLIPNPPQIAATSYILEDFNSGKVLAEKEADLRVEPASLTKVMTVYVIFNELSKGNLKLDELVTISDKAWRTEGSRMFVKVNEQVKVEDLLQGVMIQSGNDASVALAEHVAGDEATFAALMNQHAARLGMTNSHFSNSMGLPGPDHYSSARDLAKLARAVIKEFPQYYRWDSQKEFTYNKITQPNRNLLLWRDPSVDGIKTGHTEAAGYCMMTSAKRNDMRLTSVVMGTASPEARANESQSLLNYGFRFYETHRLYTAGQAINEARVWKGDSKMLPVGFQEDFYVTVPIRHFNDLKATINLNRPVVAPVAVGAPMGTVSFSLGGAPYLEQPIVALKAVGLGGFLKRAYDHVLMLVNKNE